MRLCAGAAVSPETIQVLRHDRHSRRAGLRPDRMRRRQFRSDRQVSRIGGAPPMLLEGTEWKLLDDGEILRSPACSRAISSTIRRRNRRWTTKGWLHSGDIVEVLENGEIAVVVIARRRSSLRRAARTSRRRNRECAEGPGLIEPSSSAKPQISRRAHPDRLRFRRPLGPRGLAYTNLPCRCLPDD